jgi:hypothetical protein
MAISISRSNESDEWHEEWMLAPIRSAPGVGANPPCPHRHTNDMASNRSDEGQDEVETSPFTAFADYS